MAAPQRDTRIGAGAQGQAVIGPEGATQGRGSLDSGAPYGARHRLTLPVALLPGALPCLVSLANVQLLRRARHLDPFLAGIWDPYGPYGLSGGLLPSARDEFP